MTVEELPAYLMMLRARVAESMVPVCDAIGDAYREHLVTVTLTESGAHSPATPGGGHNDYPPSGPVGGAPMMMTGQLAATVVKTPASGGGGVATCSVMPTTIYANTVHWGGTHHGAPLMVLWKKYVGYEDAKRRGWRRRTTHHESHPFMIIAVAETMADGELSRAAAESFEGTVWG